jgi:hypothetical protein
MSGIIAIIEMPQNSRFCFDLYFNTDSAVRICKFEMANHASDSVMNNDPGKSLAHIQRHRNLINLDSYSLAFDLTFERFYGLRRFEGRGDAKAHIAQKAADKARKGRFHFVAENTYSHGP